MSVTSQDKKDKSPPKSIKGRRTGRNVLKGKNIRTKEDGTQIFEDYWTEYTSSTDSMDVHLSNCSISSTSDACLSPNTPFTTDDQRDEVTSTMDVTLGSEAVEKSTRLSSTASTETQESLQGTTFQNENEATHAERTSNIRKQSMQVMKAKAQIEQGERLVLETEVMVKRVRKQTMHVMKINNSLVIEKKPQDSRKQSMIVRKTYDSPEIENDTTSQESSNQRIEEIRDHKTSMAKGETSVSETEIIDTNVRKRGIHVMISDSPVIEKEKTQNSRKQSMVVTGTYDSPRIENEITQESRNQSMEIIKDNGTSISENNEENFPATEIEDNLKFEGKSFQGMNNTPDVQKDGEINKLKETSLKVTGKKEEQNTETMEKDALVQESEKSIPEHNISEFNAVGSNESSRVIKFVDESVVKSKYNKKNKETPQRIRKSCRNRIPPLAYWRGERQLVQYLKSGEMMVSIIYEENDDNKISHKSWHAEKFLQKRNASQQKKIRILKKNGTKKILLHTHYEDIWSDQYRHNTGFSMVKTLKSSRMSSGFFKIDAGHKTGDLKPKHDMHFVVIRGYVVLNISSTKLYLKTQDSFKVPKGNTYTLKNYGKSLTVLSFCCEK